MSKYNLGEWTYDQVQHVIRQAQGNKTEAAQVLGVPRSTLWSYLRRNGPQVTHFEPVTEPTPEPPSVKEIRGMEQQVSTIKAKLKAEQEKRQDAEEELREALQRAEVWDNLQAPVAQPLVVPHKPGQSAATAVICATDWHCEANVEPDLVSDLNKYDLPTFHKRVSQLWKKSIVLIDFARRLCSIRDAVLWLGGDLINGYIHEELEEGNFAGPTEAILCVQDAVATGIQALRKQAKLDHLRIVCNFGNHGRSTRRRRIATGYRTSWEWLAYQNLARTFKGPEFSWQIARGYFNEVDIQGYRTRFHHGDNIRYWGGVGGISIPVNKAIHQWNLSRSVDYDFFGHYHQFLATYRWTACGCLVGYDPFALSIKAEYQPPTQTFAVIDKTRGKTMALPIFVSDSAKRGD